MNAPAIRLRIQMRTVSHFATQRPDDDIVCDCGIKASTRDELARRHQRSAVLPEVSEWKSAVRLVHDEITALEDRLTALLDHTGED